MPWGSTNQADHTTTKQCTHYALLVQKYILCRTFLTFILALGYIQLTNNKSTTHSEETQSMEFQEKTIKNKAHEIKCLLRI